MANQHVHEVLDTHFKQEVLDEKLPVLVDFWAPWCGPCRTLGPIIETLAAQNTGKVKVVKMNVDEAGETAATFGIRSIPTVIAFQDGKEIGRKVGVAQAADYLKMLGL